MEAGMVLKQDYLSGNFYEIVDQSHPNYLSMKQYIFSKTPHGDYFIQSFRSIDNAETSSWWFVENIPNGFN